MQQEALRMKHQHQQLLRELSHNQIELNDPVFKKLVSYDTKKPLKLTSDRNLIHSDSILGGPAFSTRQKSVSSAKEEEIKQSLKRPAPEPVAALETQWQSITEMRQ